MEALARIQEAARAGRPLPPPLSERSFTRHHGVVVATKIHGHGPNPAMAAQMLCLFTAAYNWLARYDVMVFTTLPLPASDAGAIRLAAHPASVTVVQDAPANIAELINTFPAGKKAALLRWCNASAAESLTWFSHCNSAEDGTRLNYGWQAEFRSKHLWRHPALAAYNTMLWMDADAFSMTPWHQDPVDVLVRNQLVLLFANFPQGHVSGNLGGDVDQRIRRGLGTSICGVSLREGLLSATACSMSQGETKVRAGQARRPMISIPLVHGFMHVTSLDFYRNEPVRKWADAWIGDGAFSRSHDDQAAVTVPGALLASGRAWDMWSHGITLNVMHNGSPDGKFKTGKLFGRGYKRYWRQHVNTVNSTFPAAKHKCKVAHGA